MSETTTTQAPKPETTPAAKASKSFVDTLVDVVRTWAEAGIEIGKFALENSARALDRTAKHLGTIQERLKTGEAPTKSA